MLARRIAKRLLSLGVAGLAVVLCAVPETGRANDFEWGLPAWMPRPVVPADNRMSAEKVELGRHLFYDTRMSITGDMACATCHVQSLAFTDGKPLAVGATGQVHPRNAMSLTNVAYLPVLAWANPTLDRLEAQALIPMFGESPIEMGLGGREQELLATLRADPKYQQLFGAAYPEAAHPVALATVTRALATFQRTMISHRSPYDRYRYERDDSAISDQAKRGEQLFFSERLECFHCHGGINFTDSQQHARLAFREIAFHNTGLFNIDGQGAYPPGNTGVHEISGKPSDMGRFRTPTLRNIALTAPYMHDGSIPSLEGVLDHYAAGGRTIAEGPHAGRGSASPLKSTFIVGFRLSADERADLIAFLNSLTDDEFVSDPRFANPWRPAP